MKQTKLICLFIIYLFLMVNANAISFGLRDKGNINKGTLGTGFNTSTETESCVPPIISEVSSTPSITTCSIAWTTDINGNEQVEYTLYSDASYASSTFFPVEPNEDRTNHSVGLTSLTGEYTRYRYRVKSCLTTDSGCCDGFGNEGNFYTTCTAIVYSNFSPVLGMFPQPAGTVTINWDTNVSSNRKDIKWGHISDSYTDCADVTATGTSHSMMMCGASVIALKTYYYRVRNRNMCGDWGDWSEEHGFTTDAEKQIATDW